LETLEPAPSCHAEEVADLRLCDQAADQRGVDLVFRPRARVEPVGLRPRLPDPGVARAHDDDPSDVWLDDPRDLPGVACHLERDLVLAVEATASSSSTSGVVSIRPGERISPASEIATSQK